MLRRRLLPSVLGLVLGLLDPAGSVAAEKPIYTASKHSGNYMHNYYIPPAPSTTPWAPAWSPDGQWIAFAMYGSIWKVELSSGVATELTYGSKYHSSPALSPDGEWL